MGARSQGVDELLAGDDPVAFLTPECVTPRFEAVKQRVLEAAFDGRLILVGCAELSKKCIAAIRAIGGSVPFVIEYESRFWGQEVLGLPIISPDQAALHAPHDALFVVGVWSPNHRFADTREWLASYGLSNVLPVAGLFWAMPEVLGRHYQLAPPLSFSQNRERIRTVLAALTDEESRRQFLAHLRWRISLDARHIPDPDRRHMYFDPRLSVLGKDAVIADVGAFDGDTLKTFLYWRAGAFGAYHAFEPDLRSFNSLRQYVQSLPRSLADRVTLHRLALGAKYGAIRFDMSGKPGAQMDANADFVVDCRRLDELFASQRLSFIKLDIEGMEREALEGSRDTITRDRPILAVAIYHLPNDIFELPYTIINSTTNYKYALRTYDHDGIDTVFFAIPNERVAGALLGGNMRGA